MRTIAFVALVIVVGLCCEAWGSWAWTNPQVMVDQADYVVLGMIVDVDKAAGQANIEVAKMLKGAAVDKIPVQFSPTRAGGLMVSTHISYNEGTDGVWILGKPDKQGRYSLAYPLRKMKRAQLEKVKAMVADFQAIKWSKPVNGLAAAVRALHPMNQTERFGLHLMVKNVSDAPVMVTVRGNEVKYSFKLKGPVGQKQLAPPAGRPAPAHAVQVAPGEAVYINPQWGPDTGVLKPEVSYTVTGTYSNKPAALRNRLDWSGTIQTEALELKLEK